MAFMCTFYAESLFHPELGHLEKSEAKGGDSSLQNSPSLTQSTSPFWGGGVFLLLLSPVLRLSRHGGGGVGGGGFQIIPSVVLARQ